MTDLVKIKVFNSSHLRVEASHEVQKHISDFFTFFSPGYKFSPKYKAGIWDGKIRVYNMVSKLLPLGLLATLMRFCTKSGYSLEVDPGLNPYHNLDLAHLDEFIASLNLHARGKPIEVKQHQLDAVRTALRKRRSLLLSPTSSGKSLILYIYIRYQIEHFGHNVVLMVPTTQLVEQMFEDFKEYSSGNDWNVEDNVTKIYSGQEKRLDRRLIISTWQSIYAIAKRNKSLLDDLVEQTQVLCCDEAHQYKAAEIMDLCAQFKNSPWKLGVTGTIDDAKINVLQLTGLFSEPYTVTTTKALMELGIVSDLEIEILLLQYPDYVKQGIVRGLKWEDEINFLVANNTRNTFIANLATNLKGVTLVLFTFIDKHGDELYSMMKKNCTDGSPVVKYVHGTSAVKDREEVRKLAELGGDIVILASSSIFSTGTSIPLIENIVFAMPTKSSIRVRQSIGRGLRLHENKTKCVVYDIADDLRSDRFMNRTYEHMLQRIEIYQKEEFKYSLRNLQLEYEKDASGAIFL